MKDSMDLKTRQKLLVASKFTLILVFPVFLMLANLYLFLSPLFIEYEYNMGDFPESVIFSDEQRFSIAKAIVAYLRTDIDVDVLQNLEYEYTIFTQKELSHLIDVKLLINKIFMAQKLSVFLFITSMTFLLMDKDSKRKVPLYLFLGSMITVLIINLVAVLVYINFDWLFIGFHRLVFPSDSWLFDSSDTLIQLFPRKFWVDATKGLVSLTIGEASLLGIGTYGWYLKNQRKNLIR